MNRVIKFRAWGGEAKKYFVYFGLADVMDEYYQATETEPDGMQLIHSKDKKLEISQFTGLLDKNGKEIYEGDILAIPDDYEKYGQYAGDKRQVVSNDGAFRLLPKWDGSTKGNWFDDVNAELEIIGNIYENPELLKEEVEEK